MSDMNEYPNYQQQGYPQQGYQQQYYAQPGYQQQPYQPNYAWGTPAPTIPVSKAKFPVAAMILIGIAAMVEMFFFIQNIVEGYSMDAMEYLVYLLLFAAYALFIVDMARFRADKHIFAGIALMLFVSITLYSIFAYDYFEIIGYYLEYEEFLYALRRIVYISEPVFYVLAGLYFLLSKKGFWALKLVLGILVMIHSTLLLVIYFESININILLSFIWGTCLGLGFILYSPVKDRM